MKPNIAFVTGGYSAEAEISYKSALTIEKNVDRDKYSVYKIDITPQGWFYDTGNGHKLTVDRNDFSLTIDGKKLTFDAVLIGIHGTPGEDGRLQGYFDLTGLPYTSCDSATSALTFNKRYTVAVAAFAGINVAKSVHIFKDNPLTPKQVLDQLTLPVFVKPNNGGSSIGMSKVNAAADLAGALEKAFKEDDQVLVEEFIAGREFTIGVFKSTKGIITLPITEPERTWLRELRTGGHEKREALDRIEDLRDQLVRLTDTVDLPDKADYARLDDRLVGVYTRWRDA
jgi:D-alanine-D-alanine ligase